MYCDINDLKKIISEKELINLTNDVKPADSVNENMAVENIAFADEIINSALRNKYKLPLIITPNLVKQLSADITIYRLYCRRPQEVPKNYQKNYEIALQILKELQSGIKVLDLPQSSCGSDINSSSALYLTDKTDEDRHFSNENMKGFII